MTARWYFGGAYAMTIGAPLTLGGDLEDRAYVRSATDRIMQRIAGLATQSAARLPSTSLQPTSALSMAMGRKHLSVG